MGEKLFVVNLTRHSNFTGCWFWVNKTCRSRDWFLANSTCGYLWVHASWVRHSFHFSLHISLVHFWPSILPSEDFISFFSTRVKNACLCRYAQYGEVSTKIDVYAFGVVLYELISAREAIGKSGEVSTGTLGIVAMVISHFLHFCNYKLCASFLCFCYYKLYLYEVVIFYFFSILVYIIQFEEVMNQPDPSTDLRKLVDPRLGEDYPIDSVCKV